MWRLHGCLLVVLVATTTSVHAAESPFRVPGSPYPAPSAGANACTGVTTFSAAKLSATQSMTLMTLQGVVARSTPALFETDTGASALWLESLKPWGVAVDTSLAADFPGLLQQFKHAAPAFVVCDVAQPDSVTAAMAFAAASEGVVVVDVADQQAAAGAGLVPAGDARAGGNVTAAGVLAAHPLGGGALSNRVVALQDPSKYTSLADWAVFARAMTW